MESIDDNISPITLPDSAVAATPKVVEYAKNLKKQTRSHKGKKTVSSFSGKPPMKVLD